MGAIRKFVDWVSSCIFKTVIIGGLIIIGYFGWTGWGLASKEGYEIAAMNEERAKQNLKPLTEAEKKEGFQGLKKMFGGINDELDGAQKDSSVSTNVRKKKEE